MFGFDEHQEVYGGETHESKFSHELIAGAASFEAVSRILRSIISLNC